MKDLDLKKFKVLNHNELKGETDFDYPLLINPAHIVSIKPIKISHQGEILQGYWIRLSNGKKYKATQVPHDLYELIHSDNALAPRKVIDVDDLAFNRESEEVGIASQNQ